MATTTENYQPRYVNYTKNSIRPWRLIRGGLNIEGLCEHPQCLAFNQMVIINLGFGEFDFARLILERKNRCPLCQRRIYPKKFALTKCRWWYVNHYSTKEYPLNTVGDTYHVHDLNCEYIIIETMPLLKTKQLDSKSPEVTCPICLNNITDIHDNDHATILRCSHTFHRRCIAKWLLSNQWMAHSCPVCRVDILKRQ